MKKMILSFVILGAMLVSSQQVKSQENEIRGKQIFAELGGPGVLFSINFDSRFKNNERLGFGYRIGAGTCFGEFEDGTYTGYNGQEYSEWVTRSYYTIPLGVNYILGKKNSAHMFEIGAGATFLTRKVSLFCYDVEKAGNVIGHLSFMYRISPVNGGVSFRIGFTPVIGTSGDMFPMGGVGIGYAF